MNILEKVEASLTREQLAYYQVEGRKLKTDAAHEALVDEANRRGFLAVSTERELLTLKQGGLPLCNEELVVGICCTALPASPRSLILAFQVIARGQIQWDRLVSLAREHQIISLLKWLAARTVTPHTAALLFRLRGEPMATIDMDADRFRKPYLRPLLT